MLSLSRFPDSDPEQRQIENRCKAELPQVFAHCRPRPEYPGGRVAARRRMEAAGHPRGRMRCTFEYRPGPFDQGRTGLQLELTLTSPAAASTSVSLRDTFPESAGTRVART